MATLEQMLRENRTEFVSGPKDWRYPKSLFLEQRYGNDVTQDSLTVHFLPDAPGTPISASSSSGNCAAAGAAPNRPTSPSTLTARSATRPEPGPAGLLQPREQLARGSALPRTSVRHRGETPLPGHRRGLLQIIPPALAGLEVSGRGSANEQDAWHFSTQAKPACNMSH